MDDSVIVDLLGQVGSLFTSSLELKETIDFMLKAASELVECDAATVFLLDDDGAGLTAIATFPFADRVARVAHFDLGEGIVGWAAERREVVSVADAVEDSRFKSLNMAHAPRSCLVMPLASPQRLVGALTVARRAVRPFTDVEQALMRIIGNQAAISIDNARLYDAQRRQLAEIDAQKRELELGNREIREMSRRKSEFLANMSHELRTPLNAILGFSEILKDGLVELSAAQRQECLENIHTSGRHLLELVNDILDLSKIEAGRMELTNDSFPVMRAVEEVHNVIRAISERREIAVTVDVEPAGLVVRADKSKFKQVMYNLLNNAIKFTPSHGRVWVRARRDDEELVVAVGDSGEGIAADAQESIFGEFYQVGPGGGHDEGTGLGLPLTRRIIELHGGRIDVESSPGNGSVFTFRLPIGGVYQANGQARDRILLVEDDPSNRDLTTMVLSGSGFRVDVARDGQEGLQKALSSDYDLVLMDVQLPGIDGLTLTRMLKSDPRTAPVPVVALSANAMKGDEQKALAAGCVGYIAKPIDVAGFAKKVAGYLETPTR